ncbi:MAG: TIGR03545 family protein, partial [Nitrospirota bacterium]|nr:TIGR03545 family protein [Nitrospirota bacterium]
MTKWIRWWGLGAFLLVVAVIASLWVFFVDGWVKGLIEDVGTDVVGAKVDLDHADVSLFPVGLTLTRLQVTNPKAPMTNAVEVGRIAMGLDGLNLLQRKVIVEEMSVEGVRMGTSRTTSGAVKPVREPATEENGMFAISLPSLEVPDVNTILQNEDLETMRLIEELKADLKQEKATWESRLQNLPGKGHVAKYQERVKQLKTATKGGLEGILGGVGEVQSLKEEIDRDLQSLKDAQKEFDEKVALLKRRLEQIKTAPQRDIQHLQTKYNLSPQGLANLSQTLLGSQIGSWVHQGVAWYERAKPFLEGAQAMGASQAGPEVQKPLRGKGVDVHFTEEQPLPDFLVRLARVSLNLDVGNLDGTI